MFGETIQKRRRCGQVQSVQQIPCLAHPATAFKRDRFKFRPARFEQATASPALDGLHGCLRGGPPSHFVLRCNVLTVNQSASARYAEFLQTPFWRALALACKRRDGWRCRACGVRTRRLEAHHVRYPVDWFDTTLGDLRSLCFACHRAVSAQSRLPFEPFSPPLQPGLDFSLVVLKARARRYVRGWIARLS